MADVFGSITDDALNRIAGFTQVRAPFLFNYVAPSIVDGNELWLTCYDVPDSPLGNVPKYTRMSAFPVPGIPVALPYCIQIFDADIDFHPSDQITLPEELLPPLQEQSFALRVQCNFGVACIPDDVAQLVANRRFNNPNQDERQPLVVPAKSLVCFVLTGFATGRLVVTAAPGAPTPVEQIQVQVDGIDIVDITPSGLEEAIECYLTAVLKSYVLPTFVLALQPLVVKSLGFDATIQLTPGLPHNPAIEENELRLWLDVQVK